MSAEELSRLDYVFKKAAADKVKTDAVSTLQTISPENESYPIIPIVGSQYVWTNSSSLQGGATGSLSSGTVERITTKMTTVHNVDYPSLKGISWRSGYTNWVSPSFNLDFIPQFYVSTRNQPGTPPGTGFYPIASSISHPFVFDYGSGILTFTVSAPSTDFFLDLTDVANNVLWISGYIYKGQTLTDLIGPTGTFGATGPSGPTGPVGPVTSIIFDGGTPFTQYSIKPVFDCGSV